VSDLGHARGRETPVLMSTAELIASLSELLASHVTGLEPSERYTVDEVAAHLKIDSARVYEIPRIKLPRIQPGGRGGKILFRGIDVLRYEEGLPPLDHKRILESWKPDREPSIIPLRHGSKIRRL